MTITQPDQLVLRGAGDRRMVAILLLVIPLSQIGLDVYTPALPEMTAAFDASNELVQNTVTAYILGMSVSFIPTGLIADAVGRKRVLLAGAGLLALTSVGCAVAVNLTLLLGMRFIQGIGASACLLMAAAIAADRFRGAKLVSVLGLLGAAWGAAPVLAPAVGGFVVAHGSWRLVFELFAVSVAAVTLLVAKTMPETLPAQHRAPIDLRAAAGVLGEALRHRVFLGFVVMFGLIGAAQMVFGVVGPFLFEGGLGFSPAAYGLVALIVGTANLAGELACGGLAQRTTTRRLALAAWSVMILGAVTLVVSAETVGVHGWVITLGAALVLCGIGVLDPQSKGLAMGVFDRNIGLVGGLVNTCCYLIVSAAMALMAYLPERSQAPLGWFYVASGVAFVVILLVTVRQQATPAASCSAVPSQPDSPR
jgi:DHA1 family bicyclomycin/chloramphenicol resistance-like MFS transporter